MSVLEAEIFLRAVPCDGRAARLMAAWLDEGWRSFGRTSPQASYVDQSGLEGWTTLRGSDAYEAFLHRVYETPRKLSLTGEGGLDLVAWHERDEERLTLILRAEHDLVAATAEKLNSFMGFLRRFAAKPDTVGGRCALDGPVEEVSWLTIAGPELAGRLGGAEAVARSGVFAEAIGMRNGCLWLRATERIDGFDDDVKRRVREVLANGSLQA